MIFISDGVMIKQRVIITGVVNEPLIILIFDFFNKMGYKLPKLKQCHDIKGYFYILKNLHFHAQLFVPHFERKTLILQAGAGVSC